ncbi:hypothetical protein K3495_g6148 [Podosphaera aphanis]|nr:hypothetical protein K3495_g6148 [Podosphaera aphanis]
MNQIRKAIRTGRLSPGKSTGRPLVLTLEQEEELVTFVYSTQEARRMSYLELGVYFESWNIGRDAIRDTLKRRGFPRYIARRKPLLTNEQMRLRLEWVERYFHLDFEIAVESSGVTRHSRRRWSCQQSVMGREQTVPARKQCHK